jgi:membrane protein implicated in regulation of membrane protease activity
VRVFFGRHASAYSDGRGPSVADVLLEDSPRVGESLPAHYLVPKEATMKLITRCIAGGGIAAFFFFAWIIMLLWNGLIAGHLGFAPTLNYLQAAGLWFLVSIMFAWAGIGVRTRLSFPSKRGDLEIGNWIERGIKAHVSRRARAEDWGDVSEHIEQSVKRGLARWAGGDEDADWSDLGGRIGRKLGEKLREWTDEE